jgi:nucleoside-diphosphate-sugar epimerase
VGNTNVVRRGDLNNMRVLVTGSDGYIGTVLVPMLIEAGHEPTGLDSMLFHECGLGPERVTVDTIRKDIRDVDRSDMEGIDAVIHLAAISNDPLGDLNPDTTYEINHRATVHVAEVAKAAGVERFLFSSSCSLYGAHGDAPLDETADFFPVTPYGESKVLSEQGLHALADDDFTPTYLRNATAFGMSPRLRGDLVVNNLTGFATTTGKVMLKSDGTPWRPLVHIEDISRAFVAILDAPRELVHDEAFNVGRTSENYQIREVAEIVEEVVEGSTITLADTAGPDLRNYRVDCSKIAEILPAFQPVWTVRAGVEELYAAFRSEQLTIDDLEGERLMRIRTIQRYQRQDRLGADLRWVGQDAVR